MCTPMYVGRVRLWLDAAFLNVDWACERKLGLNVNSRRKSSSQMSIRDQYAECLYLKEKNVQIKVKLTKQTLFLESKLNSIEW